MASEIMITDGVGHSSYIYPETIGLEYTGYGTKIRTLSGIPKEIIRGKRLDKIILSFDSIPRSDYEYFLYMWQNSEQFYMYCAFPDFTSILNNPSDKLCSIELDGFQLEHTGDDMFSGKIVILVLS